MSTPSPQDTRSPSSVSYGTDGFDRAVDRVGDALRSGGGIVFLFVGASKEEKQEALMKISDKDDLNLHRFKVPTLIGERLVETQGNLREAFDHADEDAAVLFFDEADVLLDRARDRGEPAPQTEEEADAEQKADQEDAALSDYFFDRVEAYPGVSIVCFSGPQYVGRLEGHDADVVVDF